MTLIEAKSQMAKAVAYFKEQLISIRIGAVSPGVIESFRVNNVRISHLGQVSRIPNGISITPYNLIDVGQIVKALEAGGFSAYMASKTVAHVSLPKVTNEDEIIKVKNHVKKLGEEAKIVVRKIRQDIRKKLNKDELKLLDKDLQKITDESISTIDELIKNKIS
jgi:ribosome recycling factor